jgi:energy-coupling factor transporter ATP-binding protein EcfA2
MAYDFSTLNDKEFEKLSRDVLNYKFALDLQDFKTGQDQGVDLRYSSAKNINTLVVQAKHYLKSGYKKLLSELTHLEKPKVVLLNPERYIIVTSVPLSNKYKNELFALFSPYMQTANDVFGPEDLNKYLESDAELERKWYKLWLSGTNVLQTVLRNAVLGRSAFAEQKIRKTIQLYCHSQSYDDAFDILTKHKYILITGQPGVGKTTLANFLTYHLLSQGHQLIYVDSDIKDAEELFVSDPNAKQVFYFDDFLGANYLEITNPRTSESGFVNFLERIKETENKYLILTTRTTIFRTALDRYEKMKRVKVDIARKEIELGKYNDLDKAKILYNHIYHADLREEHKKEILAKKKYWSVIIHPNYNPRLIEFITAANNTTNVLENKFMAFVANTLEYPEEVWRYAYEQQLTIEEKILLHIIYLQKTNAQSSETKEMFDFMLAYETRTYNYQPGANPFQNACKKLLDGILKKEITLSSKSEQMGFVNPSINDFLNNYFIQNHEARWKLIKGSAYIEQFEQVQQHFFVYNSSKLQALQEESSSFASHLLEVFDEIRSLNSVVSDLRLRTCALLGELFSLKEAVADSVDEQILNVISAYPINDIATDNRSYYIELIKRAVPGGPLESYVENHWDEIIFKLLATADDEEDYEDVLDIFEEYSHSFNEFIGKPGFYTRVKGHLKGYIESQTESWVSDDKESIFCEEDWEMSKTDVKNKRTEFLYKFAITDDFFLEENYYKEDKLGDLIERNQDYAASENARGTLVNKQSTEDKADNFEKEIEELFSGGYNPTDPDLVSARGPQF